MGFFKKTGIIFLIGVVSASVAGYFGNKYKILGTDNTQYTNNIEVKAPYKATVNENTVMEFLYIYSDGFSKTQYTLPAAYMVGYTREQVEAAYDSWQMTSFSPKKIVFTKNFDEESSQHYILKEYKGYVGVFYKKSGVLKELTSTPLSALDESERQKYAEGIEIDGDKNLVKHLESLET